ncbi:hypothetical protein NPX13_g10789 [Xylaria arbuscula]|uniref:Heterokaryon incompatibility domain-containing protein n=1 Tax=Xylaria arbuscula TaxID=114810 RepID=A0A9W8TH62_9PEZI|nr:hypothetical protein NPX13_g10789 [Xylaria arbuscula]
MTHNWNRLISYCLHPSHPHTVNPEPIRTSFIYPPLVRDTQSIRLLSPHLNQSGLSFDLQTYAANDCPPYIALSYCWGTPSPPSIITVNSHPFVVSPNLADALHHVLDYLQCAQSTSNPANYLLWVDQICINQDDEAELANQVQLMPQLFQASSLTIAWLGLTDEHSDHALQLLARKQRTTRKLTVPEKCILLKFDERSYWKRVWIMQEFILPPRLLIACGKTRVSWDSMRHANSRNYSFCTHMAPLFQRRNVMQYQNRKTHLARLLTIVKGRGCTRPFDRIFALLGLAVPGDLNGLRVDYTMPTQDFYHHVISLLRRAARTKMEWDRGNKDLAEALEFPRPKRALTPPLIDQEGPVEITEDASD